MTQQPKPALSPGGGNSDPKTSVAAIVSLVMSILGFCTAGLLGFVGLIVGIVALLGVRASEGRKTGTGLAIAGICVGLVSMVVGLLLAAGILLPALGQARQLARDQMMLTILEELHTTAAIYANEHDGALPAAEGWIEALGPYAYDIEDLINDPFGETQQRVIAMNAGLSGMRLEDLVDPETTVLFFEVAAGSPAAGGIELLPDRPRSFAGHAVVFTDGTSQVLAEFILESVVWTP